MMKTFPHVEDYLELLSTQDYTFMALPWSAAKSDVQIKLARYDVSIVNNMSDNTVWGVALTDRQADLAVKLILKYRRQFAKFGIDVSPVEINPVYRLPVRKIDRRKMLAIEDQQLILRFPYDQTWVDEIRTFSKNSQGTARWNHDTKTWHLAITEYNVNYVVTWAIKNQFEITDEVRHLYDLILLAEDDNYEIKLVQRDDQYVIINAADSLQDYLNQHVGQDLVKLIDHAGVLGYDVDEDLQRLAVETYGQPLVDIGMAHSAVMLPTMENLRKVIDYARLTQRFPVCIYDPGLFDLELDYFEDRDIVKFDHNGKTNTVDYNPYDVKIVYARKIPREWNFPVPLLVSTVEMMYGGRRLDWINRAERIVYLINAKLKEDKSEWL